jgi:hypothetical protein
MTATLSIEYDSTLNLKQCFHANSFVRYKEAARYIIVADLDDVLVPKLGPTYDAEFTRLFFEQNQILAGFSYMRYEAIIQSGETLSISLKSIELKISNK